MKGQQEVAWPRWRRAALAATLCGILVLLAFNDAPRPALAQDNGQQSATAETEGGPVQGVVSEGFRLFRGIPYAAPPTGELRWQSPRPVPPWTGVRDATTPGHRCPQLADPRIGAIAGDEDCLVLNITVPPSAFPDQPRPVMVWLHGAGGGQGAGDDLDMRRLARDGDVLVVTVNYRLGVLANFGFPGLLGSGGFGLEDQQAALRWVQRNIGEFGGDPGNVTLFGESSGGMNACAHLTSPKAAGLFQRAIVQSGSCLMHLPANSTFPDVPATSIWSTAAEAEAAGVAFAEGLGCEGDDAIACLRGIATRDLLRQPLAAAFGRAAFGNRVLPENPAEALRAGRFHRVPVMIGATRDEATFFIAEYFPSPITAERYQELLAEAFGDSARAVGHSYPLSDYDSPAQAWAAVVTAAAWVCPTFAAADLLARNAPTYAYLFADRAAPRFFPAAVFPVGAYHGSELAYLFDLLNWDPGFSASQEQLSAAMIDYWATFARTGDPNGAGLPAWPRFETRDDVPHVQSLAPGDEGIGPVDLGAAHQCRLWEKLSERLPAG